MSEFAIYSEARGDGPRLRAEDGLTIRTSRIQDLPEIAGISAEREGRKADEHLAAVARFHLESEVLGESVLLVAEAEGGLIGFGKASRFHRPEDASERTAPEGYYLSGVVVRPSFRRRGAGGALTRFRLDWIARRSEEAFYIANEHNLASIALHRSFGFAELTRQFDFPGITFQGGAGVLFRCDLGTRGRAPKRAR